MPKRSHNQELPRRTIQELVAIYKFEPTTKDVIVEGSSDKCFIEWFLDETGIHNAVVYEISGFQVDEATVSKWAVENNNRGRAIALAHEMAEHVGDPACLACIVDADLDIVLKRKPACKIVLFTDYTCMEMYAFSSNVLGKYLKLNTRRFPKTGRMVLSEITPALERLFAIRVANSTLKWNLSAVSWERSCSITETGVKIDVADFVKRYLNKNGRTADLQRFMEEVSASEKKWTSDARNQVHGHDFVELLAWYIAQHKGFSRPAEDILERALFTAAAEPQVLQQEPLFKTLLSRLEA